MKTDAKIILLSLIVNEFSFYENWTNKLCCILGVVNLKNDIFRCLIFLLVSSHFVLSFFMFFLAVLFVHLHSLVYSKFFSNFLCTFAIYLKSVKTFWYDQAGLVTFFLVVKYLDFVIFLRNVQGIFSLL